MSEVQKEFNSLFSGKAIYDCIIENNNMAGKACNSCGYGENMDITEIKTWEVEGGVAVCPECGNEQPV